MERYLFVYVGGENPTAENRSQVLEAWENWFKSYEGKWVDMGSPVETPVTILKDKELLKEQRKALVSGYSIVEVSDQKEALTIAKACPIFDIGGNVQVAKFHLAEQ